MNNDESRLAQMVVAQASRLLNPASRRILSADAHNGFSVLAGAGFAHSPVSGATPETTGRRPVPPMTFGIVP